MLPFLYLFSFFFFSERICIRRVRARVFSLGLNTVWARNAEPRAGVHNFRTIRGLVRFCSASLKRETWPGEQIVPPKELPVPGAAQPGGEGAPHGRSPRGADAAASVPRFPNSGGSCVGRGQRISPDPRLCPLTRHESRKAGGSPGATAHESPLFSGPQPPAWGWRSARAGPDPAGMGSDLLGFIRVY